MFREKFKKDIYLLSTDRDKEQFQRFIEKNPELLKKIGKTKITIKDMGWLAKYSPDEDTIFLPSDIFGTGDIPNDIKEDVIDLRSAKYKMIQHELAHKKQEEEGRLPKKMSYIEGGRIDFSKHLTDPLEVEAREAAKRVPERKIKVPEEQVFKVFRETIK